jgi:hypothetical protein
MEIYHKTSNPHNLTTHTNHLSFRFFSFRRCIIYGRFGKNSDNLLCVCCLTGNEVTRLYSSPALSRSTIFEICGRNRCEEVKVIENKSFINYIYKLIELLKCIVSAN